MPRVFISHGSKDKPFVRKLTADLERNGVAVWLDEKDIRVGDSIRQSIEDALDCSDFGIVVLSKNSIKRPWVKLELDALYTLEAKRKRSLILPAVIEPLTLPLFLQGKKYADFMTDYDIGLKNILEVLTPSTTTWDLRTTHCEVLLDIKKLDGSLVRAIKTQDIVCMRDGVSTYLDVCSADGSIINIKVKRGTIIKQWNEIGTLYVESEFPSILKKGDKVSHVFDCDFVNSFCASEELWEQRQFHPTDFLKVTVMFLKSRPPSKVWALERRGADGVRIDSFISLSSRKERKIATLEVKEPKLLATYQIFWTW